MQYEELLKKAMEKLPKERGKGERFEIPRIDGGIQGNSTIIKNFSDIAAKLRRDPKHLLKFLSRELAAPGNLDGGRAIFQTRLSSKAIETKLEVYVREFVICKICGRPDTKIVTENRIDQMKCEACGAKSPVKKI